MLLEFLYPLMGEGVVPRRSLPLHPSDGKGGPGHVGGATIVVVRSRAPRTRPVVGLPSPSQACHGALTQRSGAPHGFYHRIGGSRSQFLPLYIVIGSFPINEMKLPSCLIPFCS